jgi:hypothetical protein
MLSVRVDFKQATGQHKGGVGIQIYSFGNNGAYVEKSDHLRSEGKSIDGSVSWLSLAPGSFLVNVDLPKLSSEVNVIPLICRVPMRGRMHQCVDSVTYSLYFESAPDEKLFMNKNVPLIDYDGMSMDWFVLGVICRSRESDFLYKDISAFPSSPGDIIPQLKELVNSILIEINSGETSDHILFNLPRTRPPNPPLVTPRNANPPMSPLLLDSPVEVSLECRNCESLKQKIIQIETDHVMVSSSRRRGGELDRDSVELLIRENERLRGVLDQMEDKIGIYEKLIEKYKNEKSIQVIQSPRVSTPRMNQTGREESTTIEKEIEKQNEIILNLKENLINLNNSIKINKKILYNNCT